MGFFGLFKQKEKKRGPQYDKKLIEKFHKDHRKLASIIESIQKSLEYGDDAKAKQQLKQLKIELLGHFMEEDIKLYWYLKNYYEDKDTVETIKMFEKSIKEIQKNVIGFIDRHTHEAVSLDSTFKREFDEIVHALNARIATEESNLYPLYTK